MSLIFVPTPRPAYAKGFKGNARCLPAEDTYFMQYQRDWINDGSLEKLEEKSRRIGISFSTAYERVKNHAAQDCTLDSWISSRDEMTARLFVKDCKKFALVLNTAAKDHGNRIMEDEKNVRHTVHALAFDNNTMLNNVASNPDVFAGKGGDVVLDELALRKDPATVLGIALSTTDWGGRLASISTHRGSANAFNKRCEEIRDGREPTNGVTQGRGRLAHVTLHRVTLEYALQCGFLFKLQSKLRADDPRLALTEETYWDYIKGRSPNNEIFLQEYCCKPEDDAAAFILYELIDGCTYDPNENWKTGDTPAGRFTFGMDIGRDHDLTVMVILEWIGNSAFTREVVEMKAWEFTKQEEEMNRLWKKYRPYRGLGDRNGIGRNLCETAEKLRGKDKFSGVNFTQDSKAELAYALKKGFQDRRLRIPKDDMITADIRSIKKEVTASGGEKFYADRGKNGHADRFWALALAYRAGLESTAQMPFKPMKQTKGDSRTRQSYRQV